MNKIITPEIAIKTSEVLRGKGKHIILAGGCFDILHIGHIEFLKQAKKYGDYLFILLESDESCAKKGKNRPINMLYDRAKILSAIGLVDYIIPIPEFDDQGYIDLIKQLKPDTIAITKNDPFKDRKEEQAKLINAKVVEVINHLSNKSTTQLLKLLSENNI
ncbi:MAG: adenylyltransferase/cytidyltransferase family protein [Candidatus Levyibacteriota bacterium]